MNDDLYSMFLTFWYIWCRLAFVLLASKWKKMPLRLIETVYGHLYLSSCLLPADCLDITYMCYEFRTLLFPAQLLQARQSDLNVTSTQQSVSRWRHNEYSCCSHPLLFVQASHTPVVKVRLVVWRSDLTGQGVYGRPRFNQIIQLW